MICATGHKVIYQSSEEKKWKKTLKKSCDIVVVAGGDGTVGAVARLLSGTRTPITILPTGTANNIARTLGITGSLQELVKGWTRPRYVSFDAGVVKGPLGTDCFIEGVGIGFFAAAMSQLEEKKKSNLPNSGKPTKDTNSIFTILKRQLNKYQPQKMTVRLDGKDLSGQYILIQALNIRHTGPNLELAPRAEVNDGFLDVVFVDQRERPKLSRYLSDRIKGKRTLPHLTVRRGQRLYLGWKNSRIHIDDEPWPEEDDDIPVDFTSIDVKVRPAALVFLIPGTIRHSRISSRKRS
jgi:diacylglycerol kinase (ATP)